MSRKLISILSDSIRKKLHNLRSFVSCVEWNEGSSKAERGNARVSWFAKLDACLIQSLLSY